VTDPMLLVMWFLCLLGRIPRIVERWRAPFLNGCGWFFGVQVPPDFPQTTGRTILAKYRLRLFVPWAFELPASAILLVTGHRSAVFVLIMIVTLLTRLAYYANRKTAEDAARPFQIPGSSKPVVSVTLSLQPRTLRNYTNVWIETVIASVLLGSLVWLVQAYVTSGDWRPMRGPWIVTLVVIYLQLGLLLMKRGFVRARAVAPAESAEQYLAWRESLRRLSTTICDYTRLVLLWPPLVVFLAFLVDQWKGSAVERSRICFRGCASRGMA
jgi:hypothetical protein